jgi:hypothetical protein
MTLLLRDPEAPPAGDAGAPGAPGGPEAPAEPRTCPTCQAPLEADQDWCLNCGSAQTSRRTGLPGKSTTATVLALTALLVGGAVAACYAALQDDPAAPAPTQAAQAPAVAPTPAPQPAPAAPAATTPVPSSATPSTATPPAATVKPPKADTTPVTPAPVTPTPTPAPTTGTGTGATGTGSTGSTGSGTSSTGSSGTSKDTTADTRTTTTTTPPAPVPIKLAATAATIYDPYHRNTVADADAGRALDADPGTSVPITVADGSTEIGAGLTVDLGKKLGIRELDLTSKTPGFKIEIYATDSDELPPDVLDTRWAHLKDVTDVATDADGGKQVIKLGAGSSKYRHLLLWFTTPPTDGLTVRVSEIKLLG